MTEDRIVIKCDQCGTGMDAPNNSMGQAMADWWRKTHDPKTHDHKASS